MRTIEERLKAAATAETRDLTSVPPLRLPSERLSRPERRSGRLRLAVPVFACAAVVAAVLITAPLIRVLRPAPAPPFTGAGGPPYFVTVDHGTGQAAVHDALTGRVINRLGPVSRRFTAVAAAGDHRTFFLATTNGTCSSRVYRLRLALDGSPATETPVGGRLPMAADDLAVTPDGGRVALTSGRCNNPDLLLVDTRTGTTKTMAMDAVPGSSQQASWSADGRTLVVMDTDDLVTPGSGATVTALSVPASIGYVKETLVHIGVVGVGYPNYGVVSPDGRSLIVTIHGDKHGAGDAADYTLQRIPMPLNRGGRKIIARVPYRGWEGLTADATGGHFLARIGGNLVRIDDGRVRLLWKNSPSINFAW